MERYKIQYLPVGQLVLNPDNPRLIRDAGFKRLVKSLKECPSLFDARPCICSDRIGSLVVMGGNMRLLAAKELKYKEVPVIIMSGLTPEQEKEIVIKDNGTEFGEWDLDLLSGWSDLPLADWGVDLPTTWLSDEPTEGIKEELERYKLIFDFEKDDASFVQTALHKDCNKNEEEMDEHWRERCLIRLLKKLK